MDKETALLFDISGFRKALCRSGGECFANVIVEPADEAFSVSFGEQCVHILLQFEPATQKILWIIKPECEEAQKRLHFISGISLNEKEEVWEDRVTIRKWKSGDWDASLTQKVDVARFIAYLFGTPFGQAMVQ